MTWGRRGWGIITREAHDSQLDVPAAPAAAAGARRASLHGVHEPLRSRRRRASRRHAARRRQRRRTAARGGKRCARAHLLNGRDGDLAGDFLCPARRVRGRRGGRRTARAAARCRVGAQLATTFNEKEAEAYAKKAKTTSCSGANAFRCHVTSGGATAEGEASRASLTAMLNDDPVLGPIFEMWRRVVYPPDSPQDSPRPPPAQQQQQRRPEPILVPPLLPPPAQTPPPPSWLPPSPSPPPRIPPPPQLPPSHRGGWHRGRRPRQHRHRLRHHLRRRRRRPLLPRSRSNLFCRLRRLLGRRPPPPRPAWQQCRQ